MKLLLFEDCDSSSLHLLLSRNAFSAHDRLSEETYKRFPYAEKDLIVKRSQQGERTYNTVVCCV